MTHDELLEMFPVGCRVRSNEEAAVQYPSNFSVGRPLTGIVLGIVDGSIHVDWGEGFRGHEDNQGYIQDIHNGYCWYMSLEMIDRMVEAPPVIDAIPAIPSGPSPIPRVRVNISKRDPATIHSPWNPWELRIENGMAVTKFDVKPYLDKTVIRQIGVRIWNNNRLEAIIDKAIAQSGIEPSILVDAVTAAVIAKMARESHGAFTREVYDNDTQMAILTQPMLVAIGDQLFSLQPKGIINGSRALKIMRERVVKVAREQAEGIKTAARVEATGIITNAEEQLRKAQVEIAKQRDAIRNVMIIPEWVASNGLKVMKWESNGGNLAVGVDISTKISSIRWLRTLREEDPDDSDETVIRQEVIKWTVTNLLSNYHYVTAWLPFSTTDGRYSYQSMRIMDSSSGAWLLPHIHVGRCCMTLEGLPDKLDSYDSYRKIVKVINRGNSEINLNSLLTSPSHWHPDVVSQMPKGVIAVINNGFDSPGEDVWVRDAEITPVAVEAAQTFDLDRLRSDRAARGEELPVDITDHLIDIDEGVANG